MRIFDLIKTLSLRMFQGPCHENISPTVLGMRVSASPDHLPRFFRLRTPADLLQKITTSDALVGLDVTKTSGESTIILNDETSRYSVLFRMSLIPTCPRIGRAREIRYRDARPQYGQCSGPLSESKASKIDAGRFFSQEQN